MHNNQGHSSGQYLDTLLATGYSRQTALEVIMGVGLKLMSNDAAHLIRPDLDEAFKAQAWSFFGAGRQPVSERAVC